MNKDDDIIEVLHDPKMREKLVMRIFHEITPDKQRQLQSLMDADLCTPTPEMFDTITLVDHRIQEVYLLDAKVVWYLFAGVGSVIAVDDGKRIGIWTDAWNGEGVDTRAQFLQHVASRRWPTMVPGTVLPPRTLSPEQLN